jgi:hypothetical protein
LRSLKIVDRPPARDVWDREDLLSGDSSQIIPYTENDRIDLAKNYPPIVVAERVPRPSGERFYDRPVSRRRVVFWRVPPLATVIAKKRT